VSKVGEWFPPKSEGMRSVRARSALDISIKKFDMIKKRTYCFVERKSL
jgi:hypothetical protein